MAEADENADGLIDYQGRLAAALTRNTVIVRQNLYLWLWISSILFMQNTSSKQRRQSARPKQLQYVCRASAVSCSSASLQRTRHFLLHGMPREQLDSVLQDMFQKVSSR